MLAKCSSRGLRRQKGWQERKAQLNIDTALPLQSRNQMLRGITDWWTFEGADSSVASTWFGLRHARLIVVVLQRTVVSSFGCFVFELWVLRFRGLGASFSRFGCSVFESWVLRFRDLGALSSVFVFKCVVFETTHRRVTYGM